MAEAGSLIAMAAGEGRARVFLPVQVQRLGVAQPLPRIFGSLVFVEAPPSWAVMVRFP